MVADSRFRFACDLHLKGDLAAAADLLEQAAARVPHFASAWFTLGEIRLQLGARGAAVKAFRNARAADPDDRHGASLRLMRLGVEELSAMPRGYVQALFDHFAPRFEAALVGDLAYRAPHQLFKAVIAVRVAARKPAFFRRAIDLGCGTGLAAAAFARQVDRFIGIDLSPRMIAQARESGLYETLLVEDMRAGLAAQGEASADLVLAADSLVYVGELLPLFAEVRRVLAPHGLIAFTVETHGGEGVVLGEGLRYAHAEDHVRDVTAASGLKLASLDRASPRAEANEPVRGLVVVAGKA